MALTIAKEAAPAGVLDCMHRFDPIASLRRTAAVLACLILAGCSRPPVIAPVSSAPSESASSSAQQTEPSLFRIAANEDSFNPYLTANTLSEQCAGLLFEKLVVLSPALEPELRLAQEVINEGLTVAIRLRSGCTFADGEPITAEDAAASLNAARASSMYSARLANIADVQVMGDSVLLTLTQPDSLLIYLLDLPVMKAEEVNLPRPTACGRYTYGSEPDMLVRNPRAPFPQEGPEQIALTPISGYEEMVSGLAMGSISFYLAEESAASTIASVENYFRSNLLLFLGVNAASSNPLCRSAEGRVLLSSLLSRQALAGKYASASPATGALNGLYECVRGCQGISPEADDADLQQVMAQLGYTYQPESGLYEDEKGQPASVDLLVYTGSPTKLYTASLLQQQWAAQGIQVTLTQTDDFETYLQSIRSQQFELYIGEMKLYNNMDLTPFWSGSARYGLALSEQLLTAYSAMRADSGAAPDFEAIFAAEMPYIPLLWRGGVTVANRNAGEVISSVSDLYYSLEELTGF